MGRISEAALLAGLVYVLVPTRVYGGAWTEEAGHGQVIVTASLFRTGTTFDGTGARQGFADSGAFRQFTLNPYLEYGLTRRNTLVFNMSAPFLAYRNTYGRRSSAGLGDVEIGLRRRLNSSEARWALSAQMTVMFPAYSVERTPAPGNHQEDIETRLMVGRGATFLGCHVFADLEGAYRYRSGPPADQVRTDATVGIDLAPRLMVMGQFFVIKSLRNGQPLTPNSNPNAQSDFDLYKYQPSVVLRLSERTRLQLGWNSAFSGRNTGRGHTPLVALWRDF